MLHHTRKPNLVATTVLILTILACALPQTQLSVPTSQPATQLPSLPSPTHELTPRPIPSPTRIILPTPPQSVAEHRIATHRIYGIAGFFDQETSKSFTPRGVNYSISIPILDHYEDRVFALGVYDHNRVKADFSALSAAGYNTVRIIMDGCTSGDGCITTDEGLNPAYLDNMVDMMNLSKESNLFLLMSSVGLPELGGYMSSASAGANSYVAPGRNAGYLTAAGIQATQKYWADLLSSLIAREAPVEIVMGWEIQAEAYYQSDQPPFSLEEGTFKPANGVTYDLADSAQKNTLAVDGLRYFISQVRRTIHLYDPTALVTMGFFAPDTPNVWREGDSHLVITAPLLEESDLDFFDFHAYPATGLSMAEVAQNFGLQAHITKPILMGETGASTWVFPQISAGAIATQDWIAASCNYGFSGWLYNGYYSQPAGLIDATWGFVDAANTILIVISPQNQSDACHTTILPGRNLALGQPVTVTGALPDQTPEMAVDGDTTTQWSAGGYPNQWIEIDLGSASTIGEIRLTVGQWPEGEVLHQVWVGAARDAMQMVHEFSGEEFDYDVLVYAPPKAMENIRYVRIVTTLSPAWVAWREIEVLAPFPTTPTPAINETPESTP